MNGKAVLDTNTIIDVFNGRITLESFEQALPDMDQLISVITEIELLSFPRLTEEQETRIKRFLAKLKIIPLTDEIKRKAIEFRRKTNKKLPDSIIAATSIVSGAVLVTGDKGLHNVSFPGLIAMPVNPSPDTR
jgi:predicted nucleic acid-binding protein